MKQTEHLKLNKPDYSDVADIEKINANSDILDREVDDRLSKSEGGTVTGDVTFEGNMTAKSIDGEYIDTEVTEGSEKPVSSGAVFSELSEVNKDIAELSVRGLVYEGETKTLSISGGGVPGGGGSSGGGGSGYVLPVATKSRLGGVIIGEGISSEGDGRISPDYDSVMEKITESYEEITETDIRQTFEEEG